MVYLLSVMRKYSVAVATTNREFDSSWARLENPKTHDEEKRSSWLRAIRSARPGRVLL